MTRHYSATAQPTTLSSGISDSATEIIVGATTGFPAVDFTLALDYEAGNQEVVLVTNVSGTTLTVTRGYDNTAAVSHSAGAVVQHVHSAIDFREAQEHIDDSTGVHGVTGDVVGTSDTQTLTNKNLSSGNTFPSSLATDAEVTSAISTHNSETVAHGATGAVVGTTNTQTLTNKTLTTPIITTHIRDTNSNEVLYLASVASAVNYPQVQNSATGTAPRFAVSGDDTNIDLDLRAKGTGQVLAVGVPVVTTTGTQTLTNKTLTNPVINGVGQLIHVTKSADESVTSNTTLQDDNELVFTGAANAVYLVTVIAFSDNGGGAGGGTKFGLSLPSGDFTASTKFSAAGSGGITASGRDAYIKGNRNSSSGATLEGFGAAVDVAVLEVTAVVRVGGTGGSVKVQWAQNSSSATATVVQAGSVLVAQRIA